MSYRATKSGFAADQQRKIDSQFDQEEAVKCLYWIKAMAGCEQIPDNPDSIDGSPDNFYNLLKDGLILCKLIDTLYPQRINWSLKTFETPKIEAMRVMRERERIAMYNNLAVEYGVADTYVFPTESLHEKLHLAQVCISIRALGIEAQTHANYKGPEGYWPKKATKNVRNFTEEQLKEGSNVIGLQMGSNKGASQSGMSMGNVRHIVD